MSLYLNDGGLRAIALTFDIDWAPDFAIEALLSRLEAAGVKATLFVTHPTPLLAGAHSPRLELGLHPHLPDRLELEPALDRLRPLAPEAVGVRFHRLLNSTPLLGQLASQGFLYDASTLLPWQPHLRPFSFPRPLVRIPYAWEDDVHAVLGHPWALSALPLENPGLQIYDLHPIHVYLNTDHFGRYEEARAAGFTLEACRAARNPGRGTATLLDALLGMIKERALHTYTLAELARSVRSGETADGARAAAV